MAGNGPQTGGDRADTGDAELGSLARPAPERPYHSAYAPYNWRGWWDFGTGAIGDMACHNLDPAFWALDLGATINVEATSTRFSDDIVPAGALYHYEFPARGDMPPVTIKWYDGGLMPPRPSELE